MVKNVAWTAIKHTSLLTFRKNKFITFGLFWFCILSYVDYIHIYIYIYREREREKYMEK